VTDDAPDQRSPELADALAVPPLDDLTRRRLVRRALDASEPAGDAGGGSGNRRPTPEKRSWAPLVAAAVVILVVVVGIAALTRSGDDSSTDTAARSTGRAQAAAPEAGSTASSNSNADSGGAAASVAAGVSAYGGLGDLSTTSARDAARAKVTAPAAAAQADDVTEALLAQIADAACSAPLRADGTTIVGVGTATVHGNNAVVVVTRDADGTRTAHLLVFEPCRLQGL
jgi:hypothetical protein